jgi:hypothetical protein
MAQLVEHLPGMQKAVSLNTSTAEREREREREERERKEIYAMY